MDVLPLVIGRGRGRAVVPGVGGQVGTDADARVGRREDPEALGGRRGHAAAAPSAAVAIFKVPVQWYIKYISTPVSLYEEAFRNSTEDPKQAS